GWSDVDIGATTVSVAANSQAGFTLTQTEAVIVEDWDREQRFERPDLLERHQIRSGITVMIQDTRGPCGVLGAHASDIRQFGAEDGDFLRSIANIIGSAVENQLARQQIAEQAIATERRLRYHEALGRCAQALLANTGDNRLEAAVEALLDATQATYVFVERNYIDPELGFCSCTVAEMESPDIGDAPVQMENPFWAKVPWDQMPTSRSFLERGEPCVIFPDQLVGVERELYDADPLPVKAELDIPIFVAGEWEGLIGFSDTVVATDWTDEDLSLLSTAATMIGAFWERERSRERLEEIIRSKDQFLASVSHELRTPLTAVVGFNEILRDSKGSLSIEEREDLLETVVRQGTDLTNIVNDLLVAARADIGKLHVALVSIDIRAQATQVLEAFAGDGVVDLVVNGQSSRAIGDPDRTRQIIRNLVSNAIRYGGGDIRVDVSSTDACATVRVSDTGDPIPPGDRQRIFEAYQRAHDAKGVTGSIGLGLAISRQLARLMGGDVTYNHDGERSIFELILPLAT
ncbi:MAG: GAF domain-containing protein, partial [Acidimicrobiia bacterium]|nr:GAF domain-containing protein [Acidimicrobiia bacterium]